MRKLLFVLVIGAFAACNNGSTESTGADSATERIDSIADARIDSVQERADSVTNKIDSAASARIDSLQKK